LAAPSLSLTAPTENSLVSSLSLIETGDALGPTGTSGAGSVGGATLGVTLGDTEPSPKNSPSFSR
jgi:hypothetical protein